MSGDRVRIRVTEIFHSIQGESTQTGRRCAFVRLTGCNLRCVWCDTAYAFEGGEDMSVEEVVNRVEAHGSRLVLVTGGEPLSQDGVHELMAALLERGHEVMIETGGSLDIAPINSRVRIILDVKCPGSGMVHRNRWENLSRLKPMDEIKFVIADRVDYEWARRTLEERRLPSRCSVLFSPVHEKMDRRRLAEWILEDRLDVRLQIQLHKEIWPPDTRGV